MQDQQTSSLELLERETGPHPEWVIIFLHGMGASGHDLAALVGELVQPDWPALRCVFPNAPVRPITLNHNERMRAWYDIASLHLDQDIDEQGIERAIAMIEKLIVHEVEGGVSPNRIVLVGFSQGAAVALRVGLRRTIPLAGLVVFSGYLPNTEAALKSSPLQASKQPVLMVHGTLDSMIPIVQAQRALDALRANHWEVEWHMYQNGHQIGREGVLALAAWLEQRWA